MSKWNKKWSCDTNENPNKINVLMDRLKILQNENPKNIPVFEDIYMRPQNSNESITEPFVNNLEGFSPEDSGELSKLDEDEDVFSEIDRMAKERQSNVNRKMSYGYMQNMNLKKNLMNSLNSKITSSLDNLADLQDLGLGGISGALDQASMNDFKETGRNIGETFKLPAKKIKMIIEQIFTSMGALFDIFGKVILLIGENIQLAKLYLQQFFIYFNEVLRETIEKIANAITQNTATKREVDVFQDQTSKFLTMLLVWFFVYNWYYVVFFLDDEDDVRYNFDSTRLKVDRPLVYGFIGPAIRTVELFNKGIIGFGNFIKKYIQPPNALVVFVLFWVFFILVNANFQTEILINFFNAISGQFSFTLIGFITMAIVISVATIWYWGNDKKMIWKEDPKTKKPIWAMKESNIPTGHQAMFKLFMSSDGNQNYSFVSIVPLLLSLFGFMFYIMYQVSVNIPIGLLLISTYLFIYTFFGVFFYEGLNASKVYTGITESISVDDPDLTQKYCKPENVRLFSYVWWTKSLPAMISEYTFRFINKIVTSMFEILIILILLGGIGKYSSEWSSSIEGKVQLSPLEPGGMKQTLKQLFLWLIIINVLIIVLISMWLYRKFTILDEISEGATNTDKNTKLDLTSKVRLKGPSAGMKSSGNRTLMSDVSDLKNKMFNSNEAEAVQGGQEENDPLKELDEQCKDGNQAACDDYSQQLANNENMTLNENPEGQLPENQEGQGPENQEGQVPE